MPEKQQVRLRIVSEQQHERTVQEVPGERVQRGSTIYIRYEEPDSGQPEQKQAAKTMTTVKIAEDSLKVIRHGAVQSEQSFQLGRTLPGFYRSPYLGVQLSTETKQLAIHMGDVAGSVEWTYDMYVQEEFTGQFKIRITIQEEPLNESEH